MERIESILKKDHNKIEEALNQILKSSDNDEKLRTFNKISQELLSHIDGEEKIYYPVLDDEIRAVDKSELNESEQEHHVVKVLLRELKKVKVTSPEWDAKIEVLKENLEHHHEEEEEDFFKKSRKKLNDKEAERIGKEFKNCKEKH